MPGLSAIFCTDGGTADPALLARMGRAVAHRGAGIAAAHRGPIALEYRGDEARAPEHLACSDQWGLRVVLTGQLYNRAEIAAVVDADDRRGCSDAELLLLAYRAWGDEFVLRLDGDFAFVLHDARQSTVVCARDALGTLPLFYATTKNLLLVATEPKQLFAAGVSAQPCDEAIADFLSAEDHLIGGPRSFYRDIHRLEAAHMLHRGDGASIAVRRYWQIDPSRRNTERAQADVVEHVRWLIEDAVARRIPASGPYGCALSGGLDSSSITGVMRRTLDARGIEDPIETFSFELRDAAADEPHLVRAVSAAFRTKHHSVFLDRDNVFDLLRAFSRACDQPAINMGLLYMWRKKEAAGQAGVRTVLSGLGGDEMFYGSYHHFADLLVRLRLLAWWREVRGIYPFDRTTELRTPLRRLAIFTLMPLIPRWLKMTRRRWKHGPNLGRPWVRPELARRVDLEARIRRGPPRIFADHYRQGCYEVFQYPLVNCSLPLHEALGATFGVETRFPLLDRRLVEYMFAVPREYKILRGEVRMLQRQAMASILPAVVVESHVKKNINPVFTRQQRGHFKAEVERVFEGSAMRCAEYMDGDELARARRDFMADADTDVTQLVLWYAVALERWLEGVECSAGVTP